jgi:hypothetical protein
MCPLVSQVYLLKELSLKERKIFKHLSFEGQVGKGFGRP